MTSSSLSSSLYQRNLSVEDDWVAVKDAPFSDTDNYSLPAVAVDWNSSQTTFNVTLLSIKDDGTEERFWSDSFTISKIRRRHFVLSLAFPELTNQLPTLPQESQGIWGYIQWIKVSPKHCKKLEEYITKAFNVCGWKLFSSVFFGDPIFFEEDYTIPTLQLKRSKYEREIEETLQTFQQYMTERNVIILNDSEKLIDWHEKMDGVLGRVQEAERRLLEFDCEPYEELRDIAQKERTECAAMFNEQSLTTSTFQDSSKTFIQWEEQYVESVKHINEYRTAYFITILPRLKQIMDAVKDDVPKLTETGCKTICAKLEGIEKEIIANEINLLKCTHEAKVLERDKLRQDAVSLDEDLTMEKTLCEKEVLFYKKQCEIFAIEYEIHDKNESLVRLDLKRLKEVNDNDIVIKSKEIQKLDQSISSIARKKALLRNKMRACEEEISKMTEKKVQKHEQFAAHHAVQQKLERRREEDKEKKDERLEERQKTLLRLKEYKKKYAKPKKVKPSRYQPPSKRGTQPPAVKNDPSQSQKLASVKKDNIARSPNTENLTRKLSNNTATTIPPSTTAIPQSTTAIPQSTTAIPQSTTTIPQSTTTIPQVPPPPPPPPPPLALIIPKPSSLVRRNGAESLADAVRDKKDQLGGSSPLSQPGSLSQETVNLDAMLLARGRLKKQASSTEALDRGGKGFPSGNELTQALQNVKLRKVVDEEKPASDLSRDGAEFLRKALERMNRFTTLSDDDVEEEDEQEW